MTRLTINNLPVYILVMKLQTTKNKKYQQAFTIVELITVIVVIGILTILTSFFYLDVSKKAADAVIASDLTNASQKLKLYLSEYGSYPTAFDSNFCPTAPISDEDYCLKASQGITYSQYSFNNTTNPKTFSITGVRSASGTSYRVTEKMATPISMPSCPTGFISVPGSTTYNTSDFCVMKYEAKRVGTSNVPISQASGVPWGNITQGDAEEYSTHVANCTGCHLITDAEWLTIVQNVLSVPSNWRDNVVGVGSNSTNYIYRGHSDEDPGYPIEASTNDNEGYYLTGQISPSEQRRTLTLTNGEVIWDLAGNVWEQTSGSIGSGGQPGISESGYSWKEWKNITITGSLSPISAPYFANSITSTLTSDNGLGKVYSYNGETNTKGIERGGAWYGWNTSGIFALRLNVSIYPEDNNIGFRVATSG